MNVQLFLFVSAVKRYKNIHDELFRDCNTYANETLLIQYEHDKTFWHPTLISFDARLPERFSTFVKRRREKLDLKKYLPLLAVEIQRMEQSIDCYFPHSLYSQCRKAISMFKNQTTRLKELVDTLMQTKTRDEIFDLLTEILDLKFIRKKIVNDIIEISSFLKECDDI
ncbi:hypothetical protein ROZALSC1DRAFT_28100 [Rozella allomycis CSF55]|uniref:Uncharacterized protein n=1 Tax=Rozella allomycis (strain CSF55) TaxID=988480 RepID=A0A4P9YL87_ROZAC|nr:hypothetical protein ROZALSC1DRAFT_28100 [Rozella allomycis CSF55]